MTDKVLIYITTPSKIVAKRIATTLVQEDLIACANVIDNMESVFEYQGKVNYGNEAVLILKTTQERVPAIKEKLPALHNYECPCLVVLPIADGHEPFLNWIAQEVSV